MRIALATCAGVPGGAVDDRPLRDALAELGMSGEPVVWDDPSVDWSAYDGCLPRSTWDYMERRPAFLSWTRRVAERTRLFNPARIVPWNTHKSYLHALESCGIEIVPTVWLRAGEAADLGELLEVRDWRRAILKPCVGATARETVRFAATRQELATAQSHLDRLLACEDMMLQPYFETVETTGELSAILIDGRLTHAVRKVPVPGDFRVQDDFGATDSLHDLTVGEKRVAEDIAALLDSPRSPCPGGAARMLYARVDFLLTDDGRPLLIELELVEPVLFFARAPGAARTLARALRDRLVGCH